MTTYVLIHGAYQGGWIWRDVAAALRSAGHHVLAPSLDGCAERRTQLRPGITTETQAEEIAALLFYQDLRDAVLVGTSSGGMVLCRAAELARERVARLVFADALALFDGESIGDIVTRRTTTVSTDLATGPSAEDAAGRLFAGLDPATRDWALARYTLHPIACMQSPVHLDRFWNESWTARVIWCRQSANPPVAHQRRTADRLHAEWFELDTGHYPMLSTPAELTRLIPPDDPLMSQVYKASYKAGYPPAVIPGTDNVLRGIMLSLLASVVFCASDAMAKFLTASLPVIEIAWIRYGIFVLFAAWLARSAGLHALWPRSPTLQVVRGLCVVGSAVFFVIGIRSMQLAQGSTISFISPLLITVLSIPLLGEVVGLRRWAATAAGMLGVVIVARPGTGGFQPAALFGVASSACWALAIVITRRMASTERTATTLVWTAVVGGVVLTALLPVVYVRPSVPHLLLALVVGVLSTAGQWLTVLSLRIAPASVLAPFSYSQLIWATLAGWLVFGNLPDEWTLVGAAIIIASGLYTAHRERLRARGAGLRVQVAPVAATVRVPDG